MAGTSEKQKQGHGAQMDMPRRVVKVSLHLVKSLQLFTEEAELLAMQHGFLNGYECPGEKKAAGLIKATLRTH